MELVFLITMVSAFTPQGQTAGSGANRVKITIGVMEEMMQIFATLLSSDVFGVNAMGGEVVGPNQDNSIVLPIVLSSQNSSFNSWLANQTRDTNNSNLGIESRFGNTLPPIMESVSSFT